MVILPVTCLTNEDAAAGLSGVTGVTRGTLVQGWEVGADRSDPVPGDSGQDGRAGRRTGPMTRETAVANDETGTTASAKKTAAKKSSSGTSACEEDVSKEDLQQEDRRQEVAG